MRRLPDLQRHFFRAITRPRGSEYGREPFAEEITEIGPLGAMERLGIYARMYCARLVDALGEDHPRVASVLGAERFAALAHDYVEAQSSTHPSLRWFGHGFADFLAARAER